MEIPGFEQCEKISESGFASYWTAFQRSLNRHVTLVLLRPDAVSDPKSRQAFLRDIRIVAGLKHPALFQVYDVVEMDATLVVTVEHLTGLTLRHYVRQRGVIKGPKALTIVRWVAEGLSHVYDKTGLVHLALTPDQIWINAEGQVKILGFGFHDIFERIGYSQADVPFLSPEQVKHHAACDFQTDLYALGALLYYMVTGQVPFEGNSSEEMLNLTVTGQLPAPSLAANGGTVALNQLMARLMMKDPQNRYPGWIPAMQEMDKVLDGAKFLTSSKKGGLSTILLASPNRARPTESPEKPTAESDKPPVSKASMATTLLVLALFAGFWLWIGIVLWRMPPPERASAKASSKGLIIPQVETREELQEDQRPSARIRVIRQPAANPAAVKAGIPPDISPREEPVAVVPANPFDNLTDRVLRHLTAGERDMAALAVDTALRAPDPYGGADKLKELRNLIARGGNPESLVLEQLHRQVGKTLSIQVGGRMTPVTLNRIEGRTVIMTQEALSGSVSVQKHLSLPISSFSLGDQARLMGDGGGSEFALAHILLYLKGGAKERAAGLVPQAGPLGPAIGRYLEAAP
jgi:serine/threonine protein kinase